jgi:hypothetical protein
MFNSSELMRKRGIFLENRKILARVVDGGARYLFVVDEFLANLHQIQRVSKLREQRRS